MYSAQYLINIIYTLHNSFNLQNFVCTELCGGMHTKFSKQVHKHKQAPVFCFQQFQFSTLFLIVLIRIHFHHLCLEIFRRNKILIKTLVLHKKG